MRVSKGVLTLLAVAIVLVFAGQSIVHGVGGVPNPWAVNEDARGKRANGPLTIYGLEILPGIEAFGTGTDPAYLLHFFLRVKYEGEQYIFTGVSSTLIRHPEEYGAGETVALHEFLKKVLVELTGGTGSPYANCTPDPFGDGLPNACPNILKAIENVQDTEPAGDADELLAFIANVKLRIPRN